MASPIFRRLNSALIAKMLFFSLYSQVHDTGNNVGIGISNPSAKLEIYTQGAEVGLLLRNASNSSPGWGLILNRAANGSGVIGNAGQNLQVEAGWDKTLFLGNEQYNNHGGKVVFPGGNIGIGNSTPDRKLVVQSGDIVLGNLAGGGDKRLFLTSSRNEHYITANSWWTEFVSHDNEGWRFRDANSTSITFNTDGPHIFHNGDVGIGTTPESGDKLAVNGKISSKEIQVEIAPGAGPDYVFKEDYDLRSLEEVQSQIEMNGHLPEVPSAQEMETEGVELGEMNMILLKKIEELTLYLLDQNKRLDEQARLLQAQQEEINKLTDNAN